MTDEIFRSGADLILKILQTFKCKYYGQENK